MKSKWSVIPYWHDKKRISFYCLFLLFSIFLFAPTKSTAAAWNQTYSATCFNQWIGIAVGRLNAYNGGAAWNANKPYRINHYGLWLGRNGRSVRAPDNWSRYQNKYHWMWDHYPYGAYGWRNSTWNSARVPSLRSYVTRCLARYGTPATTRTPTTTTTRTPSSVGAPPPPSRVSGGYYYRTFVYPRYGTRRLDWCLYYARSCGRPAANRYCQRMGYTGVSTYQTQANIGPTRVIGDNRYCNSQGCDGYYWIRCYRKTGASTPARPPAAAPPTSTHSRGIYYRTFRAPNYGGARLDWCLTFGKNCGRPAANRYCQRMGYNGVSTYKTYFYVSRTRVMGDGRYCSGRCGAYSWIRCYRRSGVTTQRPPAATPSRWTYRTIWYPRWGGYRLDWCLYFARSCGRPAANYYCQRMGYRGVSTYQTQSNAGPTRVIGDNRYCGSRGCGGYRWVRCYR